MCPGEAPRYGIGSVGIWLPGMLNKPWIVNHLYLILPMVVEDIVTWQALSPVYVPPGSVLSLFWRPARENSFPSMQPCAPFPSFYFSSSLLMVPY